MICPNCLANNRKNASVCKSCGCPLRQDTIPEENSAPAPKVFRSDSGLARSDAKVGGEPVLSPMVKSSRQSPSASVPQIKVNSIVADNIDCTDNSVENELSCDTITIPTLPICRCAEKAALMPPPSPYPTAPAGVVKERPLSRFLCGWLF